MKQLALDIVAPAPPTLASFIPGGNAELIALLRRLAAGDAPERFIYLWGAQGCGRSHLLRATVAASREAGTAAEYVDAAAGAARLPRLAGEVRLVALDDVERLAAAGELAAFHLYNALRESRGALVAAGASPPAQLGVREDLATRLAWGLVYQVCVLSDEEKGCALDDRAGARGFRLPPEVREFLLRHAPRDIGSLVGMVDALDRRSLETKRPVTVPLARAMLAESGWPRALPRRAPGEAG
ncbi:MAG: DnaA regulatory inactivator Hda [Burkholderiales bacterium]|nr:DnaA regulatory inactivator Hda [Burkholderiales bacterium]